jgi:hypothetical protein
MLDVVELSNLIEADKYLISKTLNVHDGYTEGLNEGQLNLKELLGGDIRSGTKVHN